MLVFLNQTTEDIYSLNPYFAHFKKSHCSGLRSRTNMYCIPLIVLAGYFGAFKYAFKFSIFRYFIRPLSSIFLSLRYCQGSVSKPAKAACQTRLYLAASFNHLKPLIILTSLAYARAFLWSPDSENNKIT